MKAPIASVAKPLSSRSTVTRAPKAKSTSGGDLTSGRAMAGVDSAAILCVGAPTVREIAAAGT